MASHAGDNHVTCGEVCGLSRDLESQRPTIERCYLGDVGPAKDGAKAQHHDQRQPVRSQFATPQEQQPGTREPLGEGFLTRAATAVEL